VEFSLYVGDTDSFESGFSHCSLIFLSTDISVWTTYFTVRSSGFCPECSCKFYDSKNGQWLFPQTALSDCYVLGW